MTGPIIAETPALMRTTGWADYALLDSGNGKKLERYGRYTVVRPEPQCFWAPRLDQKVWDNADAVFDPTDEDEAGRWRFKGTPVDSWELGWGEVKFHGRFTNFRHLAFFPEQAANWDWLDARQRAAIGRSPGRGNAEDEEKPEGRDQHDPCASSGAAVAEPEVHVDGAKRRAGVPR